MSASTTLLHLFNMYGWYGRKNYFASHTANTNTININTENNFVTCLIHSCASFMHVTSGLCFIEYQVAYCTNKKILWFYSIVLWIRIFVLRSITYEQQKVTLFTMLFGYFAYCTHDEVPTVSFGRRQDTATERVSFSYVQRSRYN